jgi:hypothetical protein
VPHTERKKNSFRGKPDGKQPPARSISKWEDITMYLSQTWLEGWSIVIWFRIGANDRM